MQVPVRVAHGVRVLAQHDGPCVSNTCSGQSDGSRDVRIHGANDVGEFGATSPFGEATSTLVHNGTGGIQLSDGLPSLAQVAAPPRFVAERPKYYARMIAIALDHSYNARHERVLPRRIVREATHGSHAVCFNVGFVAYVQTVIVAQFVKRRVIRIMRRPDRVKVVLPGEKKFSRTICETDLGATHHRTQRQSQEEYIFVEHVLEEAQVLLHSLERHDLAMIGVEFVSVHTTHNYGFPVDSDLSS